MTTPPFRLPAPRSAPPLTVRRFAALVAGKAAAVGSRVMGRGGGTSIAGHGRPSAGPRHPPRAGRRPGRHGGRHHRQQREDDDRPLRRGHPARRRPAGGPQPVGRQPRPGRHLAGRVRRRPARARGAGGDGHRDRRGRPAAGRARDPAAGGPRHEPVPRPARPLRRDLRRGRRVRGGGRRPAAGQRAGGERRRPHRRRPGPGPRRASGDVRLRPADLDRRHHPRGGHHPLPGLPREPRVRARLPLAHGGVALPRLRPRPPARWTSP